MANLLTPVVDGSVFSGSDHNGNLDKIENSFTDLSPLLITGFTPVIGTGLSVDVGSGTALIGGRVTVAAPFVIGSLAPSTTNHLYVLQSGAGSSNTTGTQPALSAKLGTCATNATNVTSVDVNRSGGRQSKVRTESLVPGGPSAGNPASVDLAAWSASPGNGFTVFGVLPAGAVPAAGALVAPVMLTANDASGAAVTDVINLQHRNTGGVGAVGIGAGLTLEIETSTEAVVNIAAAIRSSASVVTAAAVTANLSLMVSDAGALVTPLLVETKKVSVAQAPNASANHALVNVGNQGFSGGGGAAFVGHASGTGIGVNLASAFAGNLLDMQLAGVSKLLVTAAGSVTLADAANVAVGTTTGTKIGTSAAQKLSVYGVTPVVQQVANGDLRTAMLNFGIIAGGVNTLNLNGGILTSGGVKSSGTIGGGGTPFTLSNVSIIYTTDADKTLTGTEVEAAIITINTDAVLTTGRNLIVGGAAGAFFIVRNLNAQILTIKTAAGTGIAVGSGKTAILHSPGGINVLRVTADV